MDNDSFWTVCNEDKTVCRCDWRISIDNCEDKNTMFYIYIVNAICSFLISFIGCGIIYNRTITKKRPIFQIGYMSIRPKPIEALLFFGLIFNMLRLLDMLLLITDAIPNTIFRAFLYELPWQFGICAFACYLFGVAHTISDSTKISERQKNISTQLDILCYVMITLPFITNNICSIAAAAYAKKGDIVMAKRFTVTLYFLWTVYCFLYLVWILVSGFKLISLLKQHMKIQLKDSSNLMVQKTKRGLFKVRMIMLISVSSLFVFTCIKCAYAICRTEILHNKALNLIFALLWTYDGTVASTLVVATIVFNEKAITSLGINTSSGKTNNSSYYQSGIRSNFVSQNNNITSDFELRDSYYSDKNNDRYYIHQTLKQNEEFNNNSSLSHISTTKAHLIPLSK